MENSYSHTGIIQYQMDVSLQANVLEITLIIIQSKRVKTYKNFVIYDSLPREVKKELKNVENLFLILEKKKNFMVDPIRGQIVVLLKKLELN